MYLFLLPMPFLTYIAFFKGHKSTLAIYSKIYLTEVSVFQSLPCSLQIGNIYRLCVLHLLFPFNADIPLFKDILD